MEHHRIGKIRTVQEHKSSVYMLDMEMFYELVLIAIDTTDELSKVYFHVEQIDLANMHFNKKHVNFT